MLKNSKFYIVINALKLPALAILLAITIPLKAVKAVEVQKMPSVVEAAISTNPQVLQVYDNYESVLRDLSGSIGANFLPSIDYTYGAGNDIKTDPITPGNGSARSGADYGTPRNYGRTNRQISIRQNLFNGFASLYDVKRLNFASRAKLFEVENTTQQVANDTSKAYIDLVRNRTLVKLAEDNYVSLKTLYEQLKQKADAGVAKKSDVEQAQSRLSLADYNLTVEGSNLHDNEARYQKLVGVLPPKDLDTNFSISKEIPKDVTAALTKAQLNNPALVSSFEDIKAQDSLSKEKLSAFVPRVDFKGFYDRNTNSNGIDGVYHNEGIQVDLTWNLFRGGADAQAFAKERKLYDAAMNRRDTVCRDVREQLQVGYNDIKKFTEQVAFLDQRQISIEKARDAYRKQFEINQRSLIDLLNAESELFDAKRAYTNAFHDLAIAYVRTHTQMGDVLQAIGVRRKISESLPTDNSTVANYVTCPTEAPTAYIVDRKNLDQRAQDAMMPLNVDANGNPTNVDPAETLLPANKKGGKANKKAAQVKEPAAIQSPSVKSNVLPIKDTAAFEAASPAIEMPKDSATASNAKTKPEKTPDDLLIEAKKNTKQNKVSQAPSPKVNKDSELITFVNEWAGAWSAKDAEAYFSKYADNFKAPKGQSGSSWKTSKADRLASAKEINVAIENIKVVMQSDNLARVQFKQNYASDTLKELSNKTLVVKNENGKWLIQEETASNVSKEMIAKLPEAKDQAKVSETTKELPSIEPTPVIKVKKLTEAKKIHAAPVALPSAKEVKTKPSEASIQTSTEHQTPSNFVATSPAIEL